MWGIKLALTVNGSGGVYPSNSSVMVKASSPSSE